MKRNMDSEERSRVTYLLDLQENVNKLLGKGDGCVDHVFLDCQMVYETVAHI